MPKQFFESSEKPRRSLSDVLPGGKSVRAADMKIIREASEMVEGGGFWSRPSSKFTLFGALALAVVGAIFYAFWVGATISIVRKSVALPIDFVSVAKEKAAPGELSYVAVSLSKTANKEVPATGEAVVEKRATGSIVIYNDYSTASQRLVKNTRFETPDGRIYRIGSSVTVPGRKGSGASATPGSIEVVVTADAPGEAYNIGLVDFTIPGFKGYPQFAKFYARSKTPMQGGFKGLVKVAKPEDVAAAKLDIDSKLKEELLAEAKAELPPGYVFFDEGSGVRFEDQSPAESNLVIRRGFFTGVVFDELSLSAHISARSGLDTEGSLVRIASIAGALTPEFVTPISEDSLAKKEISIKWKGNPTFWFVVDAEALKEDLAGKPVSMLDQILEGYRGIKEVRMSLHPFWLSTMPRVEDIKVRDESGEE